MDWLSIVEQVEPLEDLRLDAEIVSELERRCGDKTGRQAGGVNFYTPSFKAYATSEISGCGRNAWPAVSITGAECKLKCDHCKAKILEPMIPARTPEALWRAVNESIAAGARGMLLTGGSNHRNEVEYGPYYPILRRIKDTFPQFKIAMHTALVDRDIAHRMEDCAIDAAMMDVIGAQETITQVYHLRRTVDDFERSLECLVATRLKVVPHIVLGLHYGRFLGERAALQIVGRHVPAAVVLVVAMPFYAPAKRPFSVPDSGEIGRFFMAAREALPNTPLLLGCARPSGRAKVEIDAYAVMAGLNGVAHPSDGVVELAARLGRQVRVTPSCCSIAVGDEVLAARAEGAGLTLDLDQIMAHERARRSAGRLAGVRVVASAHGG